MDGNKALNRQIEEQRAQFESEKRELEFALADVNNAESNVAAVQASAQEDLRRQVQLTQVGNIFNKTTQEDSHIASSIGGA